MVEIEIRALIDNPSPIQDKLRDAGFQEKLPYEQLDIILDRPDATMFKAGQKIRIRVQKGETELTYKGVFKGDTNASRRSEITIPVCNGKVEELIELFSALGFPECFRVPKTRTVFTKGQLIVTFDEWPIIGCLMEIEGSEQDCFELAGQIAPELEFRSFRLKELFNITEGRTQKKLALLKEEYERQTGINLGKIELLMN